MTVKFSKSTKFDRSKVEATLGIAVGRLSITYGLQESIATVTGAAESQETVEISQTMLNTAQVVENSGLGKERPNQQFHQEA